MNSFIVSGSKIIRLLPSKIFPFISNYLLILLISGNLNTSEFAEYFYLITVFTAVYTITMSVLPQLVMRYCLNVNILYSKKFKKYFIITNVVSFTLILALIFLSIIKINYFVLAIAYTISYSLLELLLSLCRLKEDEFNYNFINIIRSFLPIMFIIVFSISKSLTLTNILLSYIYSYAIIAFIFIKKKDIFLGSIELGLSESNFFKFYFNLSLITGSLFLSTKLNLLVSNFYFNKNIIGAYSFNLDFFEKFIQNITSILNVAFTVTAYKLYDDNKLFELKGFLRNNLYLYIFITTPVIFFFAFFYNDIILKMDRMGYQIDFSNLVLLLLSFFFTGIGHRFAIVFLVTKTTTLLGILTFSTLIFSVIMNYIFVSAFSVLGLYLTQCLAAFVWCFLLFFFSRKRVNFLL